MKVAIVALALGAGACSQTGEGLWRFCAGGDTAPATPVAAPTYHGDIAPIVEGKCATCHAPDGTALFSLRGYDTLVSLKDAALRAIDERRMPPWQAAPCCAEYRDDDSLTAEERATFRAWVAAGAPAGDPDKPANRPTPAGRALARVDLRLTMPEPYTPQPPKGSTDDVRCFVIDWPLDREAFITGLHVLPGTRATVHHLILALVTGDDAKEAIARDRKDPRPGFDCTGGTGSIRVTSYLGGSLGASQLPPGFGTRVPPGGKILLNVHYSTSHVMGAIPSDRTSVALKLDDAGKPLETIIVTNPAWLVGDSMKVAAGDPDAVFYYRYRPTLFTRGKRVMIHAAVPHMHYFGSKFVLGILRADGTQDCLLEIPRWEFGWEQPYWLVTPKPLEPGDEIYVECHFDNGPDRQPVVDGQRRPPRDFAWGGNDQDMCAGFLTFAPP